MAEAPDELDALMLRIKGNEHYKKNDFLRAIELYQEAIEKADPDEALPHANLSAALFEIGNYAACVEAATTALQRGVDCHESWRAKLSSRISTAELHLFARDGPAKYSQHAARADTELLASYARISRAHRQQSKDQAWSKIIQEIPPLKPVLTGVPEYPVWGNDHAISLYDTKLSEVNNLTPAQVALTSTGTINQDVPNRISIAFCRVGDARNLYTTWMEMCRDDSLLKGEKHVDILIQDARPHTFARNLVVFRLLEDLNVAKNSDEQSLILHTLFYTYCNQLMPPVTEKVLKEKFTQVIDMLEGRSAFPMWLNVPAQYRQGIVVVLKFWQRQNAIYTPKFVQKEVTKAYFDDVKRGRLPTLDHLSSAAVSEKLRVELSIYRRTMALWPRPDFVSKHEPELATAITDLQSLEAAQGRAVIKLREYIAENWKVNPTWYADDWEEYRSHVNFIKPTIENIPTDFSLFVPIERVMKVDRFYDFMQNFFLHTANALQSLRSSITITLSLGELLAKLERARYTSDIVEWKTNHGFDRVSLEKFADFIGLSLTSHLFVSPLIKKHDAAFTAMCGGLALGLNTPQNYDCTSTCLANTSSVLKGLGVEHDGFLPELLNNTSAGRERGMFWYNTWKSSQHADRPYDQLLSKTSLSTWLYRLFLKLALPSDCPPPRMEPLGIPVMIHSPLNLSVFFRLLVHLAEIGYPGHSLSQILISILSDNVSTSARSATSRAVTEEVTACDTNEKQNFCTAPFLAEMTTLAAMFSRVLPFGLLADDKTVPQPSLIRKCTIRFPHLPFEENCHYLAIIFASFAFKPPPGGFAESTIRGTMLNQDYITKHKNDIIVVTAWKYDAKRKTGTFWMREDVARTIDPEFWMSEVYNTFTWKPVYEEGAWLTYLDMSIGERWVPEVAGSEE